MCTCFKFVLTQYSINRDPYLSFKTSFVLFYRLEGLVIFSSPLPQHYRVWTPYTLFYRALRRFTVCRRFMEFLDQCLPMYYSNSLIHLLKQQHNEVVHRAPLCDLTYKVFIMLEHEHVVNLNGGNSSKFDIHSLPSSFSCVHNIPQPNSYPCIIQLR